MQSRPAGWQSAREAIGKYFEKDHGGTVLFAVLALCAASRKHYGRDFTDTDMLKRECRKKADKIEETSSAAGGYFGNPFYGPMSSATETHGSNNSKTNSKTER